MSAWKTYWVEKTVEQDRLVYFVMSQSWGRGDPVCAAGPFVEVKAAWHAAKRKAHNYVDTHPEYYAVYGIAPTWARPTDERGTARAAWNVYVKESE